MRLIAILNPAGPVGKTTITANLGHALALGGQRVSLVDLDPAAGLSTALGLFRPPRSGIDEVILGEADMDSASLSTRDGLNLIPPGSRLQELEQDHQNGLARARLLRSGVERAIPKLDFILMDCPPSAGLLMANALLAVNEVIVPFNPAAGAVEALGPLINTLGRFDGLREAPLRCRGLFSRVVNRSDPGNFQSSPLSLKLFETPLFETELLAASYAAGRTIFEYRAKSRSAEAFTALAEELRHP